MIELTYQQKKEVDNLFNFVSSLVIKDNDEAAKYETLETDKLASIYTQSCLGTDEFFTYTYSMENIIDMAQDDSMELYKKLYTENKQIRSSVYSESFINDSKNQINKLYKEIFPHIEMETINSMKFSELYNKIKEIIPSGDPRHELTFYDFVKEFYKYGYSNLINYINFYISNLHVFDNITDPEIELKNLYLKYYPDKVFTNEDIISSIYVELSQRLSSEYYNFNNGELEINNNDKDYLSFVRNFIDTGMDMNKIKSEMTRYYNVYWDNTFELEDHVRYETFSEMYSELVEKENSVVSSMVNLYPNIYGRLLLFIEISQNILDYSYKGLHASKYFYDTSSVNNESMYLNKPSSEAHQDLTVFTVDKYRELYEEMRVYMSAWIKEGFENGELEQNNYYRILNGKPEVGVEYTFKISNLTSFKRVKLYLEDIPSLSYYDKMILIRDNPNIKFLQYILEPISISEARIANDFYILKYNKDFIGKHKAEKFISLYYENLKMLFLKFHNSAFINQPLYKQFLRLFLIFITIKAYISSMLEDFNNIEFFDQDKVTKMFRSYDLDYFSGLPLDYQKLILKNINTLIKTSGSKEILVDIPNLFGLNNTSIYKYYLVKQTNPGAENSKEYYDLAFVKVPVEATDPITYLLDKGNYLDYDDVISKDPYWNRSKSELIKALDRNGHRKIDRFNYRLTKYISIVSSVDLLKQTQDCNYVLHLIQSLEARTYKKNGDYTHGTNLSFVNSTYKPSLNNRISVIDGFVMLNWLILMRGQIDGISLSQVNEDEATYGAYFAKKITEFSEQETDPNMKAFYTSYNVLDNNMSDARIYNLENENDIYRYGYEFLTDEPNSTITNLVYKHNMHDYNVIEDINGNITDYTRNVRPEVQLNVMNVLFSIKEFFNPSKNPEYIKGYFSIDGGGNYKPPYQYVLDHSFKTWTGYLEYVIEICNDPNYRYYGLIDGERSVDNAEELFGGEDNLEMVRRLFNEYEASDEIQKSVDYLLLLYYDKFSSFEYNSSNNERTLTNHIIEDSTKMDAFVSLYRGFDTFRKNFEQLINAEESATAYKFLKRVYYSIMVTKYQEDCFPILDTANSDRSRLSEYANYLKNKDEVFFSMVIDKINNLLPTEIGSTDNITYKKNYIDGVNKIILEIIESMENYLNSKEFDNLFNLSDTNTVDNIRFYIKQILEVFKSYTIFIHDVKVDYTFDNKFSEGAKVIMELYSIKQKSVVIDSIEFFGREESNGEIEVTYTEDNVQKTKRVRYTNPKEYDYENYDLYLIHDTKRTGAFRLNDHIYPDKLKNLSIVDKYTIETKCNHILGEYLIRHASGATSNSLPTYKVRIHPSKDDVKFYRLINVDENEVEDEITQGITSISEDTTVLPIIFNNCDKMKVLLYGISEDEDGTISLNNTPLYFGCIYPNGNSNDISEDKIRNKNGRKVNLNFISKSDNKETSIIGKIYENRN